MADSTSGAGILSGSGSVPQPSDFTLPSPIFEESSSLPGTPKGTQIFFPNNPGGARQVLSPLVIGTSRRNSVERLQSSNPGSRRGSNHSLTGNASMYGGLPPLEPQSNPRRGSATGSYGLPVPPDWMRAHSEKVRSGRATYTPPLGLSSAGRDSPTRPRAAKPLMNPKPVHNVSQINGGQMQQVWNL